MPVSLGQILYHHDRRRMGPGLLRPPQRHLLLHQSSMASFPRTEIRSIVNATSVVALFGNFGQANYLTAKAAILGFSKALSVEGKKYRILVNMLVPNAGTAMMATIWLLLSIQ
ncbi:hypothetical protein BT69DRAFT_1298158 [Atractiella rhizophila]|nr:hypothetical protein BT69DRAFT_1298158 [Atractiella rhizophila]